MTRPVIGAHAGRPGTAVRAAVDGDRDTAVQALTLRLLVAGAPTARAVRDDAVLTHPPLPDRFGAGHDSQDRRSGEGKL